MHVTCKALGCQKWITWILDSFRDFDPPEHVTRKSARIHTRTTVFTRVPLRARQPTARETPAGGRTKSADVREKGFGT